MCGRFASWADKNVIIRHYGLADAAACDAVYNVYPSSAIPVVRTGEGGRELAACHWGLIPRWARDTKLAPINARAETVASKPFFRDAFRNRRCLIPANGYFEWHNQNGRKQPYFITVKDADIFSFAGIWDRWENPEKSIESCAIIVSGANEALSRIHERMPVIIDPADYEAWLSEPREDLLRPYAGEMQPYPVSTRVNNPRNQGADLIRRL